MGCSKSKVVGVQESSASTSSSGGAAAAKVSSGSTAAPEKAKKPEKSGSSDKESEDIRDKYTIGPVLGSGSFGQVREAIVLSSPDVIRAVKIIEKDGQEGDWSNKAMFKREIDLLQQLDHMNIIRFFDFYEDDSFLYVVMDRCKGGEVFQKILEMRRFTEADARNTARQMLRAIDYIHAKSIVHRDIKAENFMFSDKSIDSPLKMIDFGMACKLEQGQLLSDLCGSPHYLAPELINQRYDKAVDVWALGVLLYLLMYGRYPYDGPDHQQIMNRIVTTAINWRHEKVALSELCSTFLRQLLQRSVRKRLTASDALRHMWVTTGPEAAGKVPEKDDAQSLAIPLEVIRAGHRHATVNRKAVDQLKETERTKKLDAIKSDFEKGVRRGVRLGPTPKEEFMARPEFVRRDNKLTTAPSSQIKKRKWSVGKGVPGTLAEDEEEEDDEEDGGEKKEKPARKTKVAARERGASLDDLFGRLDRHMDNPAELEKSDRPRTR